MEKQLNLNLRLSYPNDVEKNVLNSVELTSDLMSNAEKYTFDKKSSL